MELLINANFSCIKEHKATCIYKKLWNGALSNKRKFKNFKCFEKCAIEK